MRSGRYRRYLASANKASKTRALSDIVCELSVKGCNTKNPSKN